MTATAYVLVAGHHDRLVDVALVELREAMAPEIDALERDEVTP
jgi:hypothetical protein